MFEFKIIAKAAKTKARRGEFTTPHGKLQTPELAFVATDGEIKTIPKDILPTLPVNLIIVNTFHLWVKGIIEKIIYKEQKLSKSNYSGNDRCQSSKNKQPISTKSDFVSTNFIHSYTNFPRPIMSDSGGFQVFSLGFGKAHGVGKIAPIFPDQNKKEKGLLLLRDYDNLLHINDKGVMFNYDKNWFLFTPEMSVDIQKQIGADIIFAFDECTSPLNSYEYTEKALERSHRWLMRCINEYHHDRDRVGHILKKQALFGIVQGGYFEDLRKKSAKYVGRQDVAGFGIGGTLGRSKEDMHKVIEWTIYYLPDEKPRHLFGIGQVRDIFEAVERGVDLFDCVIPTREARHKVLYTNRGRINLRSLRNSSDPIDTHCSCLACAEKLTYRQLNQLFQLHDPRAYYFATVHNIQFYADLIRNIREAIEKNKFSELKEKMLSQD